MSKLDTPTGIEVQRAIERVKAKEWGFFKKPSKSTYVLCPIDNELWDIKPIGGVVWEDLINSENSREYQTPRFVRPIIEAGFTVVKFDKRKHRELGVSGCNLTILNDPHTVSYPDGRSVENGLRSVEQEFTFPNGEKRQVATSRYIRNTAFKQQVLDAAKGNCDACKKVSFLTKYGVGYLEVHHKKWLSDGGPDHPENMVALCPNCHRQEHYGTNRLYYFP